ncbi:uncharacterized protein LOC127102047 [Lathyrus oleraceus]|uniref:uncharacterized protein LOC127102047 n=1 Tax=Pisum sativum TaxID=3888 RepID=UPI0021D02AC4|nr:uncharacterized protein LOC127102047 [Pisum sativum]
MGKPMNGKNMKSMGLIDKDLEAQGIDISDFSLDWLPDQPPNFLKRKREPFEKKKSLKLGESSATQKQLVPLSSSAPDIPAPSSPTLAELQATVDSENTQYVPEPFDTTLPPSKPTSKPIPPPYEPTSESYEPIPSPTELISQPSEPNLTFFTIDKVFSKFFENSASRLKKLYEESKISDNPSEVRTHWNGFLRWMTSEVFKLKGLSEQVRNEYIRGAKERLEARLAQKAAERATKDAEDRSAAEATDKKKAEKAAGEAEAKAKVEAEAALAAEPARKDAEDAEKANEVALTRGESLASDLAPLVLKTLEELQKEQQLVRAKLDQQDQVNSSI